MGIDSVDVITGAYPNYPDLNGGAHYYAFSPEMSNYQEAFANIVLPDKVKLIPDTGGRTDYTRNGYISLGIHGNSAGIDLGIRKTTTTNWHPCYFDMKANLNDPDRKAGFYSYPDYEAPADATNAIIVAKPISTTSVGLYVQFLNASGRDVGRTFYDEITVAAGNLTSSGEHVSCQFYRFASLV